MGTERLKIGHRRARWRGFTLIEAVAVIVILSIAFPPILWSMRRAHQARVTPARFAVARWLAAERLEDVIADRGSATRGYTYLTTSNYAAEASISGFPGFSRTVAFTETGPDLTTAGTGYKRVTVTVTFTDGTGVSRSFPLVGIVTDY